MGDIAEMKAADIMRKGLVSARPDQLLQDLERLLVDAHITGVPVIEGGRLVGVVSTSDIARVQVLADALDGQIANDLHWDETQADGFRSHSKPEEFEGFGDRFRKVKVKDVMRSQVVTCTPQTRVADIAKLLIRHHIHRVIVVEGDKPVGIVSSNDIVELLASKA